MALAESLSKIRYDKDKCPMLVIATQLTVEDQKALHQAITKKISTNALMTALHKEGYKIAWNSVDRHLKQICNCYGRKPE